MCETLNSVRFTFVHGNSSMDKKKEKKEKEMGIVSMVLTRTFTLNASVNSVCSNINGQIIEYEGIDE